MKIHKKSVKRRSGITQSPPKNKWSFFQSILPVRLGKTAIHRFPRGINKLLFTFLMWYLVLRSPGRPLIGRGRRTSLGSTNEKAAISVIKRNESLSGDYEAWLNQNRYKAQLKTENAHHHSPNNGWAEPHYRCVFLLPCEWNLIRSSVQLPHRGLRSWFSFLQL